MHSYCEFATHTPGPCTLLQLRSGNRSSDDLNINKFIIAIILAMLGLHAGQALAADSQTLRAGDIITVLFPIVTFGIAYAKDDTEGEKQWVRDLGVNEVLNTGLRVAFNGTSWGKRPDGSSYGFPSGHAGFVFSQAAFLNERYGWKYGTPALVIATAVGYIRVREDKHHWRDVIAGGALGYGVAMITVTPIEATQIAPVIGPHWLGIRFSRSF